MVRGTWIASLLAASTALAGKIVPGAYIFEFEDGHDSSNFVQSLLGHADARFHYNHKLFKGISVKLHDIKNAEATASLLAQQPVIKNMWPVQLISSPDARVEWTDKPNRYPVPGGSHPPGGHLNKTDDLTTHQMTQIDKLRAKGITGKGIKVAIIDTGVDYLHPALGGCFGAGCLVSYGIDLVGDDYDGNNTPVPDKDPMDCQGHGTHVAGIVAAQENPYGFTGAAPDVTIGAYRVFGCKGDAGNDVLIAAYNQAYEDGSQIISASIGGPVGWSEEPWAVVVSRIVEAGVPCTVAAGNEGADGLFYASTAGDGKGVTAVASVDNTVLLTVSNLSNFTVDGGDAQEFYYTPGEPENWDGVTLPLFAASLDSTVADDVCSPLPDSTPDLSKYIPLVRRGGCTFVQKAQNLVAKGAKWIIVYDNDAGVIPVDLSTTPGVVAVAMVNSTMGASWISSLKAGKTVTLAMVDSVDSPRLITTVPNNRTGGFMSAFTSWGPTWEMDTKPQFAAPGGNILSTWPRALGSYAVLSGTSMATPLVAGVYALIAQARGTFDPALIENLLSASAKPKLWNDATQTYDFLAPVAQQGGGIIQAYDAAYAKILLSHSSLSFNDTDHLARVRNFTINNTGNKRVRFSISHIPTQTFFTLPGNGDLHPAPFPNESVDKHASLEFSESKLWIGAGEAATIEVLPTPPVGVDGKRLALWSGYIAINGSDGTSLTLPYQGLSGSLHSHVVLASTDTWISKSTDDQALPVENGTAFTLPAPGVTDDKAVLPTVAVDLTLGSTLVRGDIVALKTNVKLAATDFFGTKSIGQPSGFPLRYSSRGLATADWNGQLESGNFAPPGTYKIVFRALRIFGDERKKSDWDVSETKPFSIKYV